MALDPNSYGSVAGVQSYVRYMAFDSDNYPTTANVEQWLDQQSAKINGWLARNGYQVPVSGTIAPIAKQVLDNYACIGAAGLAELSLRSSGYSETDDDRRENKFLAEFAKVEAYIASGALANLNAPQNRTQAPLYGFSVGGRTQTGQYQRPIFTRTSFGNNPTKETGEPEPGY